MSSFYVFLFGTILLAIAQYLYKRWEQTAAYRTARRECNCQRANKYPHKDRQGLDLAGIITEANKAGTGHRVYEQYFEQHGDTFEQHLFADRTIVTRDPANIQHVLGTSANDFERRQQRQIRFLARILLGRGILTEVGAAWKRSRDLIKPVFFRGELADVTIIKDHVERFLVQLPRDGRTIDVQVLLQRLFLDVSSEYLLGESFDSLSPDPPAETKWFLDTWTATAKEAAYWRSTPPFAYLLCMFPTKYNKLCKALHGFIDKRVRRALRDTDPGSAPKGTTASARDEKQADSSSRYLFINEVAKKVRNPTQLRTEVTNVFFVARDNVAMVTANALFIIARNPHVWTELRKVALDLGNQPLTFELLRSLTTFRNVYNETLRFLGPALSPVRMAIKNTILPTGGGHDGNAPIFVERGTAVRSDTWSLHHDSKIWGPSAHRFDPSRWVNRKSPMWEFIPFAGGPRNCPALVQVYTYWAYVMLKLAQTFERIENRDEVEEYLSSLKITFESRNGVHIGLIAPKDVS